MKREDALHHAAAIRAACEADPGLWNLIQAEHEWMLYGDACDPLSPVAPEYALKALERDIYFELWQPALADVPANARVMVAGGGTGRFAQPLSQGGYRVELVDASPEAVGRARRHLGTAATATVGDITDPGTLTPGAYDLVLAVEVACYATDPSRVMTALRAAIKPGGTLLFSVEARPGALLADSALASPAAVKSVLDDGAITLPGLKHVHYYSREEAGALAQNAGLAVRAVEGVCYLPDGPFAALIDAGRLPDAQYRDELRDLERRCRNHPLLRELPRAWAVTAVAGL